MMDLSLDEIIKKKFVKGGQRNKGDFRKLPQGNVNRRGGVQQRRGGVQQRRGGLQQGRVEILQNRGPGRVNSGRVNNKPQIILDARNKIIQKNRMKLTDARDRLGELAKKTDARLKLQKLRESRMGRGIGRDVGNNGVLTLSTNRRRGGGSAGRGRGGLSTTPVTLQRTISQHTTNNPWYKAPIVPALMEMDVDMPINDDVMVAGGGGMALRRTVNNERVRPEPLIRPSKMHTSRSSPYTWTAPQRAPQGISRTYADLDYPPEERKRVRLPSPPRMLRAVPITDDEGIGEPLRLAGRSSRAVGSGTLAGNSRMSVEMKSRLDVQSHVPQSHQSSSVALAGAPSGYRIVVSNLQSSVTHEDIRELFEDVGPLQTSRLVRPGTAEVVYRLYKDAVRAVDNYHNRQLDGQPMKCLLVKPRPAAATSAPQSSSNSSLRQPSGSSHKLSGTGKSSVVPDINTIHKALFNKS